MKLGDQYGPTPLGVLVGFVVMLTVTITSIWYSTQYIFSIFESEKQQLMQIATDYPELRYKIKEAFEDGHVCRREYNKIMGKYDMMRLNAMDKKPFRLE